MLGVAGLSLVAGCKGAGGDTFDYSNLNAAPAPAPIATLLGSYVTSFTPADDSAVAALLNTARYALQSGPWAFYDNLGNQISPTYNSAPLMESGVAYAHNAGLTGAGQIIAIVDAGFNDTHETIAGRVTSAGNAYAADDHGTMVASIAAGNSSTMIGVAPGASLLTSDFDYLHVTNATNQASNYGAVAQNNSWGYTGYDVNASSFSAIFGDVYGQSYLTALDNYVGLFDGNVVFAVSNDETATHAGIMDALPFLRPSLEQGWIAVGNAVPTMSGQIVSSVQMLSAGCMEAARWCILADGAWTGATAFDPVSGLASDTAYDFGVGSSFAAPQVSGALALLAEAFPTLNNQDLRLRLLASAQDDFFAGDDTVELAAGYFKRYSYTYGHGFLDVKAALLPIGPTAMAAANGQSVTVGAPLVISGSAIGDAVERSLGDMRVAVSDSFGGGFKMPATALVTAATPAPLSARLRAASAQTNLAAARMARPGVVIGGLAAEAGARLDMEAPDRAFRTSLRLPGADGSAGITLTRSFEDGPMRVDLGLRLARDGGAVMGFGDTGNGSAASDLAALQVSLTGEAASGGYMSLGGEIGVADLGPQAFLSDVGTARFDSVSLELGQRGAFAAGDRLSLGLSMPVAVTSGQAQMAVPVVMASGLSAMTPVTLDLAPEDRQMDLAVSYQTPLGDATELMLKIVHSENAGNRQGMTDTGALLAVTMRF
jgi:subtilase-type serine protease